MNNQFFLFTHFTNFTEENLYDLLKNHNEYVTPENLNCGDLLEPQL